MTSIEADVHDRVIDALARFATLDARAVAAVRGLTIEVREVTASTYLAREGQRPMRCALVLDGYVYRQRLTMEGARSIMALRIPGDFLDIQNLFLDESDHDLIALTYGVQASIAIADLRELVGAHASLNEAMWRISLIEASITREWLLNVGRRNARGRTAHLLCEIAARREAGGVEGARAYTLPMTQEQLGDCLGLTSVHINRVLKQLEIDGLIRRRKREVIVADEKRLRQVADFNERYLHEDAAIAWLPRHAAG